MLQVTNSWRDRTVSPSSGTRHPSPAMISRRDTVTHEDLSPWTAEGSCADVDGLPVLDDEYML